VSHPTPRASSRLPHDPDATLRSWLGPRITTPAQKMGNQSRVADQIVSIVDEHTRESLGGAVERNVTGEHLIGELSRLAT
jgi:hypothetical protein